MASVLAATRSLGRSSFDARTLDTLSSHIVEEWTEC